MEIVFGDRKWVSGYIKYVSVRTGDDVNEPTDGFVP